MVLKQDVITRKHSSVYLSLNKCRSDMRYLFVIAHPDDEADVGGTIYKLSHSGHEIAVVF